MSLAAFLAALALASGATARPADSGPTWSPGGLQIAYSHADDSAARLAPIVLRTLNVDGSPGRVLVHPTGTADVGAQATDPAWSPEGRQIAFTFSDPLHDAGPYLSLVNLDGSPSSFAEDGSQPDWSPDGTKLVYALGGLRVVGRDGSGGKQLTHSGERNPAWSRDGTRIAYERGGAVWTMRPDGTEQTRVTSGTGPAWGPGGALALVRNGRLELRTGATAGGFGFKSGLRISDPAWSRDGTKIAFAADGPGCGQPGLFTIEVPFRAPGRLTGRDCRIVGTNGADVLPGTPSRDIIDGRGGRDTILAGAGSDEIRARDGFRDTITCGAGRDLVLADGRDVIRSGCEQVRRR